MYQITLNSAIELSGIGLHTGKQNHIKILPSEVDSGISFKFKNSFIKAIHSNSIPAMLCSALSNGINTIFTTEHILATLYALGINNAVIETSTEEIPIMDGSAAEFVRRIMDTGLRIQNKDQKVLYIRKQLVVKHNDSYAIVKPSDTLKIKYTIDFPSKVIGRQSYSINVNPQSFIDEIAYARTFCEYKDIEKMRSMGLIKGGSLDNAIVVDDLNIINDKPLRYIDEFVRHKILDSLGDISLIGYNVIGEFEFYKSGHNINHSLIEKILSSYANYEIIETITDDIEADKQIAKILSIIPKLQPIKE